MFYIICFLSPVLFVFAAGMVTYRPVFAHVFALSGKMALPWLHWELRDAELGNIWLFFNVPDKEVGVHPVWQIKVTIIAVFLIVLAIATAALRLLPSRWQLRKLPLRERTWPAFAVSLLALAIWFSQSVMPYRIPGPVDYSQWPILQILNVEKCGLQFHESCLDVYGRPGLPFTVSFSGNNRRLFQYNFHQKGASGEMPRHSYCGFRQ